jgi:hypothetical protein
MAPPRIALIHALAHSPAPINEVMARLWPQAMRMNLLDDSLSADLARTGRLDEAMHQRFLDLSGYALGAGAQALLFTCSAFGPCIQAVKQRHTRVPVLAPNEAMVNEASAFVRSSGRPLCLVASFQPTLTSMPAEFAADVPLRLVHVPGAMQALNAGDFATHDALVAEAAAEAAAQGCGATALAQFSLARAAPAVAARTGLPVFTTPESAVRRLMRTMGASASMQA